MKKIRRNLGTIYSRELKPQHIRSKKGRGLPPAIIRKMAQTLKPREPSFVCEECHCCFKLGYLRIQAGIGYKPDRNLCRDCFKATKEGM